jgi:hypothetical protein
MRCCSHEQGLPGTGAPVPFHLQSLRKRRTGAGAAGALVAHLPEVVLATKWQHPLGRQHLQPAHTCPLMSALLDEAVNKQALSALGRSLATLTPFFDQVPEASVMEHTRCRGPHHRRPGPACRRRQSMWRTAAWGPACRPALAMCSDSSRTPLCPASCMESVAKA